MAKQSLSQQVQTALGLSIWLAGHMVVVLLAVITLLGLPAAWAVALLALQVAALLAPIDVPPPAFIARWLAFSAKAAQEYFPIRVVWEDRGAFKEGTAYVIGYEPHSVLPLGISIFTRYAPDTPPALKGYVMGTSTIFIAPFMRHMCWWVGIRAVSREVMRRSLAAGVSCALCPGGVQECCYMQEGKEVAFLRKRTGFVKLALETGSPLVPVFAFGQTPHYSYARPLIDFPRKVVPTGGNPMSRLARRIGYLPMLVWGWCGTALPRRMPMYVVVGKPISVPKVGSPAEELVQEYLGRFISELQRLFEEHKAAAGHPKEELLVI